MQRFEKKKIELVTRPLQRVEIPQPNIISVEIPAKSGGYNCHRRQFMLMTVPGPWRDEAGPWNSLQVSVELIGHATAW